MSKTTAIEREIYATGALQIGNFTAHNGEQGNCKIVLDSLLNDELYRDLLGRVVKNLAGKLKKHEPEIVLPMPEGANRLGRLVALELGARAVLLEWEDRETGKLRFKHQSDRIVVCRAESVALVDDVLRTGSQLLEAVESIGLENKKLVGGVVHDRSSKAVRQTLGFPVEATIRRYLPLRVKP